ncbi:MAG: hypothetical protein RL722_978 [Pseudomonadota bacterium]|jgi:glycosyltransferase involved in cell wall biosynthesis/phosphoserine phosphatase
MQVSPRLQRLHGQCKKVSGGRHAPLFFPHAQRQPVMPFHLAHPAAPDPLARHDAEPEGGRLPFRPAGQVSVIIPALNEAQRIAAVVRHAWSDPVTAEVIVIDDSSTDDTATLARAAGAQVVTSTLLGKGASMRDGAGLARQAVVAYLDGDLAGLRPGLISQLCEPLLDNRADFVKGAFSRGGGRVTELTARPMLQVFFPELAHFAQPLGGVIAARADLLRSLHFEDGYGVDIGLLIDAYRAGARLQEVAIGHLEHDPQPLRDLTAMANEISRVIYGRARSAGRLHIDQIVAMYERQRQAAASIDYVYTRRHGRRQLLLLGVEGCITPGSYFDSLVRAAGLQSSWTAWSEAQARRKAEAATGTDDAAAALTGDEGADPAVERARFFRFVHRSRFEAVARELPLRPGLIELVNQARRLGFMVGLVSSVPYVATDLLRRRIFADFALSPTYAFQDEVCTGVLHPNAAFFDDASPGAALSAQAQAPLAMPMQSRSADAGQVVRRFREDPAQPPVAQIWALGAQAEDLPMLRAADRPYCLIGSPLAPLAQSGQWRAGCLLEPAELLPLLAQATRLPETTP